jgi:hypothetical protein
LGNFGKNWQGRQLLGSYSNTNKGNRLTNHPKINSERKDQMKRKSIISLAVVMAVILLVSLVVVSMAFADKGGTNLPFKATLAGAARWEFPGTTPSGCTVVTTLTEATGQGTHMGQIKAFFSHCPADPNIVEDGRLTLVAANGDELYGTYNYDPASEDNYFPINLNGGTGAFGDASGTVIMTYEVTPQFIPDCNPEPDPFPCMDFSVPWPWSATMTGTISY